MSESEIELLQRILGAIERLGSEASASSVEIKTSTRGTDVTVKAYPNSDVRQCGNAALEEYYRVVREIEARLMGRVTA